LAAGALLMSAQSQAFEKHMAHVSSA